MSDRTIYLAMLCDPESAKPVRAFESRKDALAFCERAKAKLNWRLEFYEVESIRLVSKEASRG